MLLAHQIELRPTPAQRDYLDRACGSRRHCFNQLLAHFSQDGVKWSKKAAVEVYKRLREEFDWYGEVSQRVTRNAIDDLDNAFKHFFRRIKNGEKPGFPRFKRKDNRDGFAMREASKFGVFGRELRVERLKTRIKMRMPLRFSGQPRQVTITKKAGKYFASILVETTDYRQFDQTGDIIGVDLGVKAFATLSDGTTIKPNNNLRRSLRKLKKRQKKLSKSKSGSNRRAKAKAKVAKLHKRVADQRKAVCHELSDMLTRQWKTVVLEDLNVRGMVKNHHLALSISDAGFGMLRQFIEYKAKLRGVTVILADRFFPSTKTCYSCGAKRDMPLGTRNYRCDCGWSCDRDLNASLNLEQYGRDTLERDPKRTRKSCVSPGAIRAGTLDRVNTPSKS